MDTVGLAQIVKETIRMEQANLSKADHPHVAAAHSAAIKDLNERFHQIRHSTRLLDRLSIEA